MKHSETFYTTKNINDLKLAIFSDIHYHDGFKIKILDKIANQVINSKPDYICIIGDILDESKYTHLEPLTDFLTRISSIAPIICVLGNHDEKSGSLWHWKYEKSTHLIGALNKVPNLHLLADNYYKDNNIVFYGFNLSFEYYEKYDESYDSFCKEVKDLNVSFPNDTYNILLFHSPENIYKFIDEHPEHEFNKVDIILSGHMHNGCFPFWMSYIINKVFKSNRGIMSPQKKLFPDLAHGIVKRNKDGYIYEGITKLALSTRKFHYFDFLFSKNIEVLNIKKSN